MRLWTIQGIEFYNQLQNEGVAYCTTPSWDIDDRFIYAYHWMAKQMIKRIGEPPIDILEYPLWAWYQYDSAKKKKPPRRPSDIREGLSAFIEIEIPDKMVLLSDHINWHAVLNQCALANWKQIDKKIDVLDKTAGRILDFKEYPLEIQNEIENSWEAVFDLDRRDKDVGLAHKRNRSIQATFWALYPENIVSVEFFERKGNNVRQIII